MTNTYPDNTPYKTKLLEELRCLRCVMERILRVMDEGLFVDYQMEKFGGATIGAFGDTPHPEKEMRKWKRNIIKSAKKCKTGMLKIPYVMICEMQRQMRKRYI
jgi:hypothetical protein